MERCRVLMINDFSDRGGAEIVYRQSVGLFRTLSGVEVESFYNSQFVEQTS